MPCHNCDCASCAMDRVKLVKQVKPADGWYLGRNDAYYLTRDGASVAVVYERVGGWSWWNFLTSSPGRDRYPTREAAQAAAEEATK